jgi:adenosylcobinamide-phosphate synthase
MAMAPDLVVLLGATAVDCLLGEPPAALHPVVWIGRVTRRLERAGVGASPIGQLAVGALIAVAVPLLFAMGALLLVRAGASASPILALVIGVWLLKSTFAIRALGRAGRAMRDALARDDVDDARRALGSLCSRDASRLDAQALAAGAIESLAENASDSIVAPLFYFVLFGLPGAMLYRAVNTLDAMIGYRGKYEYLGKAAARLDDLLNLLPARITAFLLIAAGAVTGHDARRGWRILRRDGAKTASPNAGRPMAAMAGLLGVQLAKEDHYVLGDPARPIDARQIDAAWCVVMVATGLALALTALALSLAGGGGYAS